MAASSGRTRPAQNHGAWHESALGARGGWSYSAAAVPGGYSRGYTGLPVCLSSSPAANQANGRSHAGLRCHCHHGYGCSGRDAAASRRGPQSYRRLSGGNVPLDAGVLRVHSAERLASEDAVFDGAGIMVASMGFPSGGGCAAAAGRTGLAEAEDGAPDCRRNPAGSGHGCLLHAVDCPGTGISGSASTRRSPGCCRSTRKRCRRKM